MGERIAVLGAGPMGLAVAYQLARDGHEPVVFEADDRVGGMTACFDFSGLAIERYYHFHCTSDTAFLEVLEELEIAHHMRWVETKMGYWYQERMVLDSGIACPVLRPTLMFGWFDRKHLGWLSRFMQKVPVFPIPGHGRYLRQPLYVGDFSNIIISCIENRITEGIFNISGHEKVDYIDIIREIKRATRAGAAIVNSPYSLFHGLLWLWAVFDRNPPFTTQQLAALVAKDEFEVIDWPGKFGVRCTPFAEAMEETFRHPVYSNVILEF